MAATPTPVRLVFLSLHDSSCNISVCLMEKIMPRLEFLQQLHAAADVLLKAQLAVQRQSTPRQLKWPPW